MAIGMTAADNAEINIGDTSIRTLRKAYGAKFAEGCGDDEKLRNALCQMDEASRSTLYMITSDSRLARMAAKRPTSDMPLLYAAEVASLTGSALRSMGHRSPAC